MYLDNQHFTSEQSFLNSDSFITYSINYSNSNIDPLLEYSRYALILSRKNFIHPSTLDLFKEKYTACDPVVLNNIDEIFSKALDPHKYNDNYNDDTGYHYSPPYVFSSEASILSSISIENLANIHAKSLQSSVPTSTYPVATRYVSSNGTLFIERPPFQATIDYKPGNASTKKAKLPSKTVWIPWTIYVFNPNYPGGSQHMYFSYKSLTSMSDSYYPTYLPNTHTDGRICYSNSLSTLPILSSDITPDSMYSYMINEFFAGSWNSDLVNPWYYMFYERLRNHIKYYEYSDLDKEEFSYRMPLLFKLFHPSPEIMQQAELNKIQKIWQYYNENIPSRFFYDLPSDLFHYSLLSLLSTFSLKEILSVQEEVHLIYQDVELKGTNSIFNNFHNYLNFKPKSFEEISTLNTHLRTTTLVSSHVREIVNLACAENSLFSEFDYNKLDRQIIAVNVPPSNTPFNHLSYHARNTVYFNSINELPFAPSFVIPIYNVDNSQSYYLIPSSDISVEQLYLEMLKVYIDNSHYFPCQSTPFYEIFPLRSDILSLSQG